MFTAQHSCRLLYFVVIGCVWDSVNFVAIHNNLLCTCNWNGVHELQPSYIVMLLHYYSCYIYICFFKASLSSLLSSSGPHQQALIYRSDGLTAYQPVASGLALANTRYNPVQASGYHIGQLPGTTTTSSLQHLAHIPAQSYYIGANTPPNAGQHQASFQSRQHLQGLTYGQVVAAGGSPQGYISGTPPLATTTSALTSYNVGYGHLTTTSSYTQPAGNLSLMPPSVAPPPSYDTTPPDSYSSPHPQPNTPSRQWSSQSYQWWEH